MKRKHLTECGCCGSDEPAFIFNVRHRGIYRRLCTACVLTNHPGSFCPICFDVYDNNPPPSHNRAICLNCPSISHLSCAGTSIASPRYQCPPCANPNFSFFDEESGAEEGIGEGLAKQLVAAARIALVSMNKAVAVARAEADRTVKEAAVARKRAREALERVEKIGSKSPAKKVQKKQGKIARSLLAEKRIQIQNGGSNKKQ